MKLMDTLTIVVVCAALSGLASCSREDAPAEERLRPVRYVQVSDDTLVRDRNFSGVSKSKAELMRNSKDAFSGFKMDANE